MYTYTRVDANVCRLGQYGEVNMFFPEPGSGEKPELEGLDNFWVGRGW